MDDTEGANSATEMELSSVTKLELDINMKREVDTARPQVSLHAVINILQISTYEM